MRLLPTARRLSNSFSRGVSGRSLLLSSDAVHIVEVGPRDGLQNEPAIVSLEDKVTLIRKLAQAGCAHIEVGSIVSPKRVPNMANSLLVLEQRDHRDHECEWCLLVPNIKGMHKILQAKRKPQEIAIFASASEGFSQKNIQCSIQESLQRFEPVAALARDNDIRLRGYVSCVFQCPYDGDIEPSQVAFVAGHLLQQFGCYQVSLGDTIGTGTPGHTRRLLHHLLHDHQIPPQQLAGHFHNTYGQALANVLASLDMGVRTFDAAVAGLGGCPFAKSATGNLATEDLVYMLNGMEIHHGIDLEKLIDAGSFISQILGRSSRSNASAAIQAKEQAI